MNPEVFNPVEQKHYFELAIFPADVDIPLDDVSSLWKMDVLSSLHLAQRFVKSSLLDLDLEHRTLHVPDRFRIYMTAGVKNPAQLHAQLVDTWGNDVYALSPNAAYAWQWVIYHLCEAGRDEELRRLFDDQRWMKHRLDHDAYTYDNYRADLMVAWRHADAHARRQIEAGDEPTAIILCVRYALIYTSINSLERTYISELIVRAVESGYWTVARASRVALRMADAKERNELYIALLELDMLTVSEQAALQHQALALALVIEDVHLKADVLASLIGLLGEEGQEKALTMVLAIEDFQLRVQTLGTMAERLKGEGKQIDHILGAVLSCWHEMSSTKIPISLKHGYQRNLVKTLGSLAGRLEGVQRDDALTLGLEIASSIWHNEVRAEELRLLAKELEGDQRDQALAVALKSALAISDKWHRAEELRLLAKELEGDQRDQALAAALKAVTAINKDFHRLKGLEGVMSHDAAAAMKEVMERSGESQMADALSEMAGLLTGEMLEEALAAAYELKTNTSRSQALGALAGQLTGARRKAVLEEALNTTLAIEDELSRSMRLRALAPQLTDEVLEEGLTGALAIGKESHRVWNLEALAEQLEEPRREMILEMARKAALVIEDESLRATSLKSLAGSLKEEYQEETLAAALEASLMIEDKNTQARKLIDLAEKLEGDQRERALAAGLEAALAIPEEWFRTRALKQLSGQLEGELLEKALTALMTVRDEQAQANALDALTKPWKLGALGVGISGKKLQEEVDRQLAIEDKWARADGLGRLLTQVEEHTDNAATYAQMRYAILDLLLNFRENTRQTLLEQVVARNVFAAPLFSQTTRSSLADQIKEICEEWTWHSFGGISKESR